MFGFVTGFLAICGTMTATVQVARGLVRGLGRLREGDPRGAFAEAAGGILAPVLSAIGQALRLGEDIFVASTGIAIEEMAGGRALEA